MVLNSIEVLATIRKIPVISLLTNYVCFRVIDMFGPSIPLVQIKKTRFTSDENLQIEKLFLVIKLLTYTQTLANYFFIFSFNVFFLSSKCTFTKVHKRNLVHKIENIIHY